MCQQPEEHTTGAVDPARLLAVVYGELRRLAHQRMARERPDHTLTATALVHEAYLRIVGDRPADWNGRGHFFGAAAQAMRRILIEHARRRGAAVHGGDRRREPLGDVAIISARPPEHLEALDAALTRLEDIDPRKAQVVSLRYFAGLTVPETAAVMDISPRLVNSEWTFARAWLSREVSDGRDANRSSTR